MPEPPALTWSESCDLGAEVLHAEVDGSDRDLLGQGLDAHRIVTADTIQLAEEWL